MNIQLCRSCNLADQQSSNSRLIDSIHDLADVLTLNHSDILYVRGSFIIHFHLNQTEDDMKLVGEIMIVGTHGIYQIPGTGQILHKLGVLSTVMQDTNCTSGSICVFNGDTVEDDVGIGQSYIEFLFLAAHSFG